MTQAGPGWQDKEIWQSAGTCCAEPETCANFNRNRKGNVMAALGESSTATNVVSRGGEPFSILQPVTRFSRADPRPRMPKAQQQGQAMLARLSIRDIVLIDRLDLDFASGLAVLTGQTGAGKSILLDAFALALGARGDVALVRQGAEQGQVTAAFDLPSAHPVRTLMAANDIQ